jgi:hypothetical protein
MDVTVSQPSMRPGTVATLTATLTDSGIPQGHSAKAVAQVTAPDGMQSTQVLDERQEGTFAGDIATAVPGVHRILVRAEGATLRGEPFAREELRTLAVWARGDERPTLPPEQPQTDWSDLLRRVLRDEASPDGWTSTGWTRRPCAAALIEPAADRRRGAGGRRRLRARNRPPAGVRGLLTRAFPAWSPAWSVQSPHGPERFFKKIRAAVAKSRKSPY